MKIFQQILGQPVVTAQAGDWRIIGKYFDGKNEITKIVITSTNQQYDCLHVGQDNNHEEIYFLA